MDTLDETLTDEVVRPYRAALYAVLLETAALRAFLALVPARDGDRIDGCRLGRDPLRPGGAGFAVRAFAWMPAPSSPARSA